MMQARVFSQVGIIGRYWVFEVWNTARPTLRMRSDSYPTWLDALAAANERVR